MAVITCAHSKSQINRAGEALVVMAPNDPARDAHLLVISNWRECHAYPLLSVRLTLEQRAARVVSDKSLVVQRLKRLPSIALKLTQNPSMRLARMHDIAGCRAILPTMSDVDKLAGLYKTTKPRGGPSVARIYDYITNPKPDGYRSIHVVVDFHSKKQPAFDGQQVEIQIRSKLQHLWATAIETVQAFTGQALKTRIKQAEPHWERFMLLCSAHFADVERRPSVPNAPSNRQDRKNELSALDAAHGIISIMVGWSVFVEVRKPPKGAHSYLLELDTVARRLGVKWFTASQLQEAEDAYIKREKETEGIPGKQIVLASAGSLSSLKKGYPNYYVDVRKFCELAKGAFTPRT